MNFLADGCVADEGVANGCVACARNIIAFVARVEKQRGNGVPGMDFRHGFVMQDFCLYAQYLHLMAPKFGGIFRSGSLVGVDLDAA